MSKTLVAYFSASGVTKGVAQVLSQAANGDLFEINPLVPYTNADLNWMDKNSRSTREMKDKSFRPPVSERLENMDDYDLIFLGFPIWWYIAPTIINTFLETYDFADKKIVLFATSGGSGFGKTLENLKPSCASSADMIEGKLLRGRPVKDDLVSWVRTFL
ncbi:MAG: flavodoxin [Spirochaetales bacterium]|nr:flavodoxin [Spirochaetales bacterium]